MRNLVLIGQAVAERMFKDYTILCMYIAQGQGQITPSGQFFLTKNFTALIIHCNFQPLVLRQILRK